MAGFRPYWPAAASGATKPDFTIDKVNAFGTFTATTDFSMDYFISDNFPGCMGTFTVPRNCSGVSVIETNNQGNGEAYALAGAYAAYDGTNTAGSVFFSTLDQTGNVINTVSWSFGGGSVGAPRIRESLANPGQYYICANTDYQTELMVIKVDAAGTQLWANIYSMGGLYIEGRDLIESPYNSNDIIVVGRVDVSFNSPTAADAFFIKLDDSNNGTVTSAQYYNFLNWDSDDWFNAIEPAVSSTGGQGYIIGGRCYGPTTSTLVSPRPNNQRYQQLMCKLDVNGGIVWDALIKTSAWTGTSTNYPISQLVGVFERFNSGTQDYEYYGVAGYTYNIVGVPQNSLMVYKLDNTGVTGTLTPTEFRYTLGYPHQLSGFDHAAITGIETGGGADDGIQAYGMAGRGTHYFVKAYFNGASGCNETITDIDSVFTGLNLVGNFNVHVAGINQCNQLSLGTNATGAINVVCSSPTLTGGSNARQSALINSLIVSESAGLSETRIYPNPIQNQFTIDLPNNLLQNATVEFRLYDLQSRLIFHSSFNGKNSSQNEYFVDLAPYKLSNGFYRLEVSSINCNFQEQIKIVVNNN